MVSIRKAKKLGIYKKPSYDKKLYRQTVDQVNKANKRLRSLQKEGYYNSWASKKLFKRLDVKDLDVLDRTKKGSRVNRIKLNNRLTNTDLIAILKATSQFLLSKTSTARGIKSVESSVKKSLYQTLKVDADTKITEEDIEDYYEMLSNDDFDYFSEKIGASTLWNVIEEAKEELAVNENKFITILNRYITINDEKVRNKAIRLYNKYVI